MSNPIISVISLNQKYIDIASNIIKNSFCKKIEEYIPQRDIVFYVSPANSLGFMDGGIDKIYSEIMFPGIVKKVKQSIRKYSKQNKLGQYYLPIGSSIIIKPKIINIPALKNKECYLVVAPTMLMPQSVNNTQNTYYATVASLYNIFKNSQFKHKNCEIIFTSMCCGYGNMQEKESFEQFIRGINEYQNYKPNIINNICILHEPNLDEQPNYYENTAFKNISYKDIIR
jgi:O-acetyl-ADP-ribose deacetylase (regulator of RNase III)